MGTEDRASRMLSSHLHRLEPDRAAGKGGKGLS